MSGHDSSDSWRPAGWHNSTVVSLAVNDAKAAIDFWVKAFGAVIVDEMIAPNGKLMHASLRLGDTMLMAAEPTPSMGVGPSHVSMYVYVPDADAAYKRAVDAGVTELEPVKDYFWGDRCGAVRDAWGIRWTIATRVKDMAPGEAEKAAAKWAADPTSDMSENGKAE